MTPETTRMLEQFFFFNLSENDNTDDRWHLFCPGINWMSVILWVLALCLLAKLFQLYVLLLFTLAQFCNFSMSSLFFFLLFSLAHSIIPCQINSLYRHTTATSPLCMQLSLRTFPLFLSAHTNSSSSRGDSLQQTDQFSANWASGNCSSF